MFRSLFKFIVVIIVYGISFKYVNFHLYEEYDLGTLSLGVIVSFIASFFASCFNILCYHKTSVFHSVNFYILFWLNIFCFLVNGLEIFLLLLYLMFLMSLNSSIISFNINKKAGYLSLIYLCFVVCLLISNQLVVLLN